MRIQPDVYLPPQLAMALAVQVCAHYLDILGIEFVLTGGMEGDHGDKSKHWHIEGIDFRATDIIEGNRYPIAHDMNVRCGSCVEVLYEAVPIPHFHMEFDPHIEKIEVHFK